MLIEILFNFRKNVGYTRRNSNQLLMNHNEEQLKTLIDGYLWHD